MLDFALASYPAETGGVLMGLRSEADIRIVEIVGAGPGAVHLRGRFEPDGDWQEHEIARIYTASSGRVTYLGDWHSHPDGAAVPSKLDNNTAKHIAQTPGSQTISPLMLIVGMSQDATYTLRAYQWDGKKLQPHATRVTTALSFDLKAH